VHLTGQFEDSALRGSRCGEELELARGLRRCPHGVAGQRAQVLEEFTEPAHLFAVFVLFGGRLCPGSHRAHGRGNGVGALSTLARPRSGRRRIPSTPAS
jgi:hypothetical protein